VSRRLAELGLTAVIGPELEFFVCEPDGAGSWRRYADEPGNVYVVGRKGDPRGLLLTMLRHLRDAGLRVTAGNHEFSAGQFEINLDHSELVDSADRAFRLKSAVQEIARHHGLLATFMAKPIEGEPGESRWVWTAANGKYLVGTFDGLPEGARFTSGGQTFAISYLGGSGNDVVLTALPPSPRMPRNAAR